jgi:predicted membrane chloride channel (bestrophin family)
LPILLRVVHKGRYFCTPLAINSTVAGYVGFALFLLLGFRVSEAYGRYMQGVALWNDSISGGVGTVRIYNMAVLSINNPVPHPAVTKSQAPNKLIQFFAILIVKTAHVAHS